MTPTQLKIDESIQQLRQQLRFSHWLFKGNGGLPGICRLVNMRTGLCVTVAVVTTDHYQGTAKALADKAFVPILSILVGTVLFSVPLISQSLQEEPIGELASHRPGGPAEYINAQHLTASIIAISLLLTFTASTGLVDWLTIHSQFLKDLAAIVLIFFGSLSTSLAWDSISQYRKLVITRAHMKQIRRAAAKQPAVPIGEESSRRN